MIRHSLTIEWLNYKEAKQNLHTAHIIYWNILYAGKIIGDMLTSYFFHGRMEGFFIREKKFRFKVKRMVKHQAFYWIVIVCVFLNTIIVATEHYNQPKFMEEFQGNLRRNTLYSTKCGLLEALAMVSEFLSPLVIIQTTHLILNISGSTGHILHRCFRNTWHIT